jgi:multiple antibiotic resistance protein
LLIILGVTYGFMLAATPILRVIGKNGAAILVRVMGMILAALSVELVLGALGLEKWTAAARGFFS